MVKTRIDRDKTIKMSAKSLDMVNQLCVINKTTNYKTCKAYVDPLIGLRGT